MSLRLEPVQMALSDALEGRLVFTDDRLVAILVQLSAPHEADAGSWFLEAAFGRLDVAVHPTFPNLEAAQFWISGRIQRALHGL